MYVRNVILSVLIVMVCGGSLAMTACVGSAATPNKRVVACQHALLHSGAAFVRTKDQVLDKCATGIFKCTEVRPGDSKCIAKALSQCGRKLGSLRRGEDKFRTAASKQCGTLTADKLLSSDGLGFQQVACSCLGDFGDDVHDTASALDCVLRNFGRAAEHLFASEQTRARELFEFVAVNPLPLCDLPKPSPSPCLIPNTDASACKITTSSKEANAVVTCGGAITKAGRTFSKNVLAAAEKCVKATLACAQTATPKHVPACHSKAQKTCSGAFGKLSTFRTGLASTIAKGCGKIDFTLLANAQTLNLQALAASCHETTIDSLATYVTCLQAEHESEVCSTLRSSVPRIDDLLQASNVVPPTDSCLSKLAALLPACDAATLRTDDGLSRVEQLAVVPRNGVTAGTAKFILDILRPATDKQAARVTEGGVRPPKNTTGGLSGRITGIRTDVPRFIPANRMKKITIDYQAPSGTKPMLLIVARDEDGTPYDLFEIPLDPQGTSDDLEVDFDDRFGGCVRLEFATAQDADGGDVSPYVPVEQVPEAAPLVSATPTRTATSTPSPIETATPTPKTPIPTGVTPTPTPTSTPPDVQCNEGVIAEPVPLSYGSKTVGCAINTPTDLDRFAFQGTAGDDLRIVVHTGTGLDPHLEVRDPDDIRIVNTSCGGACSVSVDSLQAPPNELPVLTKTGPYTISISDINEDEGGSYELFIERFRPATPPVLTIGASHSDTIDSATDIDSFAFQGTAGDDLRIVVHTGTGLDPHLEVRDPDDIRIVNTSCGGACSVSVDSLQAPPNELPVLTKTGTYMISISDINEDEGGSYEVSTQCLGGPC